MVSLGFRSARASRLAAAALLAAVVGCGGSTDSASTTGGGAGAGAASGASTGMHMDEVATTSVTSTGTSQHAVSAETGTTTGTNGTGMMTTTGAGGAGGGESVGAGGAGGDACDGAYLTVYMQDSVMTTYTLTESCAGDIGATDTTHALAYEGYSSGGPNSMHELTLDACESMGALHFSAAVPLFAPGTNDSDRAEFDADQTHLQTTNGLTFTLTALGPQGGAVVGSYSGTLVDDHGAPELVNGDFKLCRIPDFLPP